MLDNEDKKELIETRPDAGATANICLLHKDHLICANVGDSRTTIFEDQDAFQFSEDHKPDLERERERVEKAGGSIIQGRVNFKLTLTRAIGDLGYKSMKDQKQEE